MNILDPIGAGVDLVCTYFYVKAHRYAWPLGMLATSLNFILYYQKGIYGDMSLEVIYFASMIYGWYQWTRGGDHDSELAVSHAPKKTLMLSLAAGLAATVTFAALLKYQLHSTVPYLDAITTVMSLIAQYYICRKYIETWVLWFIVDVIYISLYLYKGLPFHGVQYAVFLGMAIAGHLSWVKKYHQQVNLQDTIAVPG